jgi:hypothetical protein
MKLLRTPRCLSSLACSPRVPQQTTAERRALAAQATAEQQRDVRAAAADHCRRQLD